MKIRIASSPSHIYANILRNDFLAFVHRAFLETGGTELLSNWHLEVLAAKLEEVRLGLCKRLIINIPPRHLKSHMATVAFPAWLLGHDPSKRIITVCYAQDLSSKFARDCRSLIDSPFYKAVFGTRLSPERQAVEHFETTEGGYRMSSSIQGGITGFGADILILDDPMKAGDATSNARRETLNDQFDGTLRSRLNSQEDGAIIIVMQRLHADDLIAHVQKNEKWDVVSFPAIAVDDEHYEIETPYGRRNIFRKEGQALQPDRQSLERLEAIRASMSPYHFAAQYQQNPAPREGNMIKTDWLKYYDPGSEPAKFQRIFQSWDTANKTSELNDFSVCTTWGVKDKHYYLLDVFRKRLNYPDLKMAVNELRNRYPRSTAIIEDKASGTQLIQDLTRERMVLCKAYLPPTGTDKEIRVDTQSVYFATGRVHLRKGAHWLKEYVAEITGFPNMKYDDQVDSTIQFLDFINQPGAMPMNITPETLAAMRSTGPAYWQRPRRPPY